MSHVRAQINVATQTEILKLISNLSNLDDTFTVENFNGSIRVNARSIMGMLYITAECGDQLYLVNNTHDGVFPALLDELRVVA